MKTLLKAISDHYDDAAKAASQSLKNFAPETIHRMRVALKQLRAVFNLLLFSKPHSVSEEDWNGAKKIFRQAGKVRERQLLRERILALTNAEDEPRKTVSAFLAKKEQTAQRKFKHHYTDRGEKELKKLHKKMLKAADEITADNLHAYFDDLQKRINELRTKKDINEAELHALRKLLKELKYNRPIADAVLDLKPDGLLESEKLNAWEELIGKWHDEVIFLQRGEKLIEQMQAEGALKDVITEMEDLSSRNSEQLLKELTDRFPPGSDGTIEIKPAVAEPTQ
jgi:CHAD domain-containing protein